MIKKLFKHTQDPLEGTNRMEAFSDAIIAIVMTLLVFEIKIPVLISTEPAGVINVLWQIGPQLVTFAFSFLILAIIWVNHYHFLHPLVGTDQKLLWYNNFLLFWVCLIPFATKFLADYHTVPTVVAIYSFVLFMMAVSFTATIRYVFFQSKLLPHDKVSAAVRKAQYKRALYGPVMYGLATILAFISPNISFIIFALVIIFYFIPQRLTEGDHGHNEED